MTEDSTQKIALLAAEAAGCPDKAGRIEQELRKRMGGQQVTITRRAPLTLDLINAAMREKGGSVARAAKALGCGRETIYRRLRPQQKSHAQPV